jgi:hypothetical protein
MPWYEVPVEVFWLVAYYGVAFLCHVWHWIRKADFAAD